MPATKDRDAPLPSGIAKVGLDGRFLSVDPALEHILGHEAPKLAQLRFQDITHPDDLLRDVAKLENLLSQGRGKYSMMKRYRRSDGGLFWAELDVTLVQGSDGAAEGFVSLIKPLDVDYNALSDIHDLATRDPLTRLFNRTTLDEQLMAWVLRARRLGRGFGVLLLDLDNFKSINDTLGHVHGDHVLESFAARLGTALAPGDIAARFGGDEVVVLCPDIATREDIMRKKFAIKMALGPPFEICGTQVQTRASIGCALYPEDGESPSQLLKSADAEMYAEKHYIVDTAAVHPS